MKPLPLKKLFVGASLLIAGIPLAGCNVRYDDDHADRASRLYGVAVRFNQAFQQGGMAGVGSDVDECYRQATVPLIKRFSLQDCLSYDYAAFTYDTRAAQVMFHGLRTPPFEPNAVKARMDKFGRLDGFADRLETVSYVVNTTGQVMADVATIPGSFLSPIRTIRRQYAPNPGGFF